MILWRVFIRLSGKEARLFLTIHRKAAKNAEKNIKKSTLRLCGDKIITLSRYGLFTKPLRLKPA